MTLSTLSIRRINSVTGERLAVLVDEGGLPVFYPTLWVTVSLRGGARAVNTIQNALNAIKCLYAWQGTYSIDIEQRFSEGKFLTPHEIHSLRDFLQESLVPKLDGKVVPLRRKPSLVGKGSQYARMTVAAEYLDFLARRLFPSSEDSEKRIATMVSQIKANRPNQMTKTINADREEKHLDDFALDALEVQLTPGAEKNPFSEYAVQFRNSLMFTILRVTGIRRGELLNLRVDDIDFSRNTLKIVRRHDSPNDKRHYQPVAKTRERTFPLAVDLVNRIHDYVVTYRNKVPGVKRHGYLFVTHKEGKFQGDPLSNSSFSKFIESLKEIVGEIHAHKLRHHWNYSFSKLSNANCISSAKEESIRSYLMGWEPTSGTAAIYNRRHIKKTASESMLEVQKRLLKKK